MAGEVKASVNVRVGANVDALNAAFDQAQRRASSFSINLAKAAALGAAAFVSLKEGVFGTVEAFAEADASSNRLRSALLTQGILSKDLADDYETLANKLSELTGKDDDAIKSMMASGQAMLGTIQITEPLTKAIADLAAGTGMDLSDAFEKVTKTIGSHTNALAKNGFHIDENLSRNEKLAEVIRQIEGRYNDQAQASQNVGTAIASLGVQFGNLREAIGARFAPVVEKLTRALTEMIKALIERPEILDFIAKLALMATAGLSLVAAFLSVKSALAALAPIFSLVMSPIKSLLGVMVSFAVANPLVAGIGLIIAAGAMLYFQWENLKKAFEAFVMNISTLGAGLKNVLVGVFTLDSAQFAKGLDEITAYFKQGMAKMGGEKAPAPIIDSKAFDEEIAKKNEANRKAREAEIAEENAHSGRLKEIQRNKTESLLLQNQIGTKQIVDLKNQESALIKQLDEEAANGEIEGKRARMNALKAMLEQNRAEQIQAESDHLARLAELNAAYDFAQAEAKALNFQADFELERQQKEQLFAMALTEKEAKQQVGFDMVKDQIERNNNFLKDQAMYGEGYAKLNRAIHSQEVKIAGDAANELVALTQSKNATLKAVGKAASITQIAIATAEGAATVFAKLNALFPIAAPFVGAAAAGSVVAYGAERTAQVVAANSGGIIPGGGPNLDSVPALLTPGELVVPRQNFNEVVGAVKSDRGGNGDVVSELQALRSDLQGARPHVVIHGDMMSDDSFVDKMIQRISDRLEFGNAKLSGVNA